MLACLVESRMILVQSGWVTPLQGRRRACAAHPLHVLANATVAAVIGADVAKLQDAPAVHAVTKETACHTICMGEEG